MFNIVIDLEGIQAKFHKSENSLLALGYIKKLLQRKGGNTIILVLSSAYPDAIKPLRDALDGFIEQGNIRVWHSPQSNSSLDSERESLSRIPGLIKRAFLASLRPDLIHLVCICEDLQVEEFANSVIFDLKIPIAASLFYSFSAIGILDKENKSQPLGLDYANFFFQCDAKEEIKYFSCGWKIRNKNELISNFHKLEKVVPQFADESFWELAASDLVENWLGSIRNPKFTSFQSIVNRKRKPVLAFISPLPPERSGISNYSAELLPYLAKYYEIVCIVEQKKVCNPWIIKNAKIQDIEWLMNHISEIDRILYHIGNSPFHQAMPALLQNLSGVVVLHDFYIGHLMTLLEGHKIVDKIWIKELYEFHGYKALQERFVNFSPNSLAFKYPVCGSIIRNSKGIIAHSEHSKKLANEWYGDSFSRKFAVIPHLRVEGAKSGKVKARKRLGLAQDSFVVCSFGHLGPTKLNDRIINAWARSALAPNGKCNLIFVGQNSADEYGANLNRLIEVEACKGKIFITGYVSEEEYNLYLAAADVAIQLRTLSRGESSGAVLDCMNHGVPVIINSHGALSEFDENSTYKLPDRFEDSQLITALEFLKLNPNKRSMLSKNAKENIRKFNSPKVCAQLYFERIEEFYSREGGNLADLITDISDILPSSLSDNYVADIAKSLSLNYPKIRVKKRLLLDVTVISINDYKTGIQRVVRALCMEMMNNFYEEFQIELVRISDVGGYWHLRTASKYALELMDCNLDALDDVEVEPNNGDVFLGLDLSGSYLIHAAQSGLFRFYQNQGVACFAVVYDILPITLPEVFPHFAEEAHKDWVSAISNFDGAICISESVADDLNKWMIESGLLHHRTKPYCIKWVHLGADYENSSMTFGIPENGLEMLNLIASKPTFLMVGTIEPRKGYLEVINEFTDLWRQGLDINLVIVGREGWIGVDDDMRRDIPLTISTIVNHPELSSHLFWVNSASDEYLSAIYKSSFCLIAASYGEGFGLPIVEAFKHNLNVIARDIPVFREVAGNQTVYFNNNSSSSLSKAILGWLEVSSVKDFQRPSINRSYSSWNTCANEIINIICTYKN